MRQKEADFQQQMTEAQAKVDEAKRLREQAEQAGEQQEDIQRILQGPIVLPSTGRGDENIILDKKVIEGGDPQKQGEQGQAPATGAQDETEEK